MCSILEGVDRLVQRVQRWCQRIVASMVVGEEVETMRSPRHGLRSREALEGQYEENHKRADQGQVDFKPLSSV